jgi:hypothetical protein
MTPHVITYPHTCIGCFASLLVLCHVLDTSTAYSLWKVNNYAGYIYLISNLLYRSQFGAIVLGGCFTGLDFLTEWLWWGETVSQIWGQQRAYCSSPWVIMWAWRAMVMMMMPAGDNSWLVHQNSLAVIPAETSGVSWSGRENFAYQYLKYIKGF